MSNSLVLRQVPIASSSPSPGTIELSSVGGGSPQRHPNPQTSSSCTTSCLCPFWDISSWIFSIVTYIIEIFIYIWASYVYAKSMFDDKYIIFGLSVGFLTLPTVVIATISLIWYYNLDRFHRRRKERDPHNMEFIEYRKKFTFGALVLHILLLGVVYRYSQLIYLTLIGKKSNLPYLRRDAILIRFFHSFISSAPHLVIHLYTTIKAIESISLTTSTITTTAYTFVTSYPSIVSALAISIVSVLYSTLSLATSDRVSGKNRRVILPAHITQILWYVCTVTSRVLALSLFAYAYQYYVFAVIGGHWILMVIFLLVQRTTFCADLERQSNGDLKFTRRYLLEIPFNLIAAAIYNFVYFNLKRGRTRFWAGGFHLIMFAENTSMAALIFVSAVSAPPFFLLSSLVIVIGLYIAGLAFSSCFYLLYHPKRTNNCYWVGIPRKCVCCFRNKRSEDHGIAGRAYRDQNGRVTISEPTLVSHNGFVPKNMLPVGPQAVAPTQNRYENQVQFHPQSAVNGAPSVGRDQKNAPKLPPTRRPDNNISSLGRKTHPAPPPPPPHFHHQRQEESLSPNSSHATNTGRTISESNPVFSDTDLSSNAMEGIDRIIDTPLFSDSGGNGDGDDGVPEAMGSHSDKYRVNQTRLISQGSIGGFDTESQLTCTDDTGIDVDSDLQLTPGIGGVEGAVGVETSPLSDDAEGELKLPVFVDVPVEQHEYKNNNKGKHFFHEEESSQETAHQQHHRESITPTLPTPPSCSPTSPLSLTPSFSQIQWQHPGAGGGQDTAGAHQSSEERNSGRDIAMAQSSPERPRRAPRSPIGARSHMVNNDDTDSISSQQNSQNGKPRPHPSATPRAVTPRSPKGARRLLVQQQDQSSSSASPERNIIPNKSYKQAPPHPPPIPPKQEVAPLPPPVSDGLTRGLTSLVPTSTEARAHSSSPNPTAYAIRQNRAATGYSRGVSYNGITTTRPPSMIKTPRGVASYNQGDGAGALENISKQRPSNEPPSGEWRRNMQAIHQKKLRMYRQSQLDSHGSSPDRSSSSGERKILSISSPNGIDGPGRPSPHSTRTGGDPGFIRSRPPPVPRTNSYHSPQIPKSAFVKVSPSNRRSTNMDERNYRRSTSSDRNQMQRRHRAHTDIRGYSRALSNSPHPYPKVPHGAHGNAPKMLQSPPSPHPDYIDEPLPDLNSSDRSRTQSHGSGLSNSDIYDRLPAENENLLSPNSMVSRPDVSTGSDKSSASKPDSWVTPSKGRPDSWVTPSKSRPDSWVTPSKSRPDSWVAPKANRSNGGSFVSPVFHAPKFGGNESVV